MPLLLQEIKRCDKGAAAVLKDAGLNTDKDLQSLTRQDLQELLPGAKNFKLRRDIFDLIHKQKPVEKLLRELKEFIPDQSFRDALTNNGVLVDYLEILKDMKSHMNSVQSFLDAHIGLLEEFSTNQPDQKPTRHDSVKPQGGKPAGHSQVAQDTADSGGQMAPLTDGHPQVAQGPVDSYNGQTGVCPGEQGSSSGTGSLEDRGSVAASAGQSVTHAKKPRSEPFTVLSAKDLPKMVYQAVVAGKTFDADQQLMDKVKEQLQGPIEFIERDKDYQVTLVFCPISSRVASDVEAAMADVKGDKPVILVLMHHTREAKYTTPMRTWHDDSRVLLHVNVFYHETQRGLLKCEQNNTAALEVRNILLERFIRRSEVTSGNAQAVGAERGLPGSASVRGGGNTKHSDTDNSGGIFSIFRRN